MENDQAFVLGISSFPFLARAPHFQWAHTQSSMVCGKELHKMNENLTLPFIYNILIVWV